MTHKQKYDIAIKELAELLQTRRASLEARLFAAEARLAHTCIYCNHEQITEQQTHPGACRDCNLTIAALLNYKSYVVKGKVVPSNLPHMLRMYRELDVVPPVLRGRTGDASDVINKLKECIILDCLATIDEVNEE